MEPEAFRIPSYDPGYAQWFLGLSYDQASRTDLPRSQIESRLAGRGPRGNRYLSMPAYALARERYAAAGKRNREELEQFVNSVTFRRDESGTDTRFDPEHPRRDWRKVGPRRRHAFMAPLAPLDDPGHPEPTPPPEDLTTGLVETTRKQKRHRDTGTWVAPAIKRNEGMLIDSDSVIRPFREGPTVDHDSDVDIEGSDVESEEDATSNTAVFEDSSDSGIDLEADDG